MLVVTSGSRYIDIDAYASCIAYRELLKLKGIPAKAISTAKTNESITKSLGQFDVKLDELEKSQEDEYIVIDVSNLEYFDPIIKENHIIEVIDHHTGFESYWREKLGEKADIEFIGAVATKIVERYEQENLLNKMKKEIAYLLMSAILDNTLNFKAKITTSRDKMAYQKLEKITGNESNYHEKYFLECQQEMEKNLVQAIQNDTKLEHVNEIIPYVFGQLTVWDKNNILENKNMVVKTLREFGEDWMMNLICLKDEKSYILAENEGVKERIEKLMGSKFKENIMILPEVWLRKEITKKSFQ